MLVSYAGRVVAGRARVRAVLRVAGRRVWAVAENCVAKGWRGADPADSDETRGGEGTARRFSDGTTCKHAGRTAGRNRARHQETT